VAVQATAAFSICRVVAQPEERESQYFEWTRSMHRPGNATAPPVCNQLKWQLTLESIYTWLVFIAVKLSPYNSVPLCSDKVMVFTWLRIYCHMLWLDMGFGLITGFTARL
jgi:hypothetical protein